MELLGPPFEYRDPFSLVHFRGVSMLYSEMSPLGANDCDF